MLKTISAALLAASIIAAPALAANAKVVHANPMDAKAQVTTTKHVVKKVRVASRHHRHHYKLARHFHRSHTASKPVIKMAPARNG